MAERAVGEFECPRCRATLEAPAGRGSESVRCPFCQWEGEVYVLMRGGPLAEAPADAMPEHATCAHHPDKQAVEVCAGTGDYICSLCAIEVGGQIYSAAYVNRAGADALRQHFQRALPRPDRSIGLLIVLMIIPCFWWIAPLLVVWAAVLYVRMIRQYRNDALYQRVVSMLSLIVAPIVLILAGVIYAGFVLAMVVELF